MVCELNSYEKHYIRRQTYINSNPNLVFVFSEWIVYDDFLFWKNCCGFDKNVLFLRRICEMLYFLNEHLCSILFRKLRFVNNKNVHSSIKSVDHVPKLIYTINILFECRNNHTFSYTNDYKLHNMSKIALWNTNFCQITKFTFDLFFIYYNVCMPIQVTHTLFFVFHCIEALYI